MYGWLGSAPKHLNKYASLYTNRNCAVLYGTAPTLPLSFRMKTTLDAFVVNSVKKASMIIRDVEADNGNGVTLQVSKNKEVGVRVPIIMHYMSNGGAFPAERLRFLVHRAKTQLATQHSNTDDNNHQEINNSNNNEEEELEGLIILPQSTVDDLVLVSERLRYEVFDSAPAYLHKDGIYHAINEAVPNFFFRTMIKTVISVGHWFMEFTDRNHWRKERGETNRPNRSEVIQKEFWTNMVESDLCQHQAYIYSTGDTLTDSEKLEDLIRERRHRGVHVIQAKFDDSDHVSHLRSYPQEYNALLDRVMDKVTNTY